MFLDPFGDTLFYRRRVDGLDTLFVFQPDRGGVEIHAQLASGHEQLRAWPTAGGNLLVASPWPRAQGGLSFRIFSMRRVRELLRGKVEHLNEKLTDLPLVREFSTEERPLPVDAYERIKGEVVVVPGLFPREAGPDVPALYVLDGRTAVSRVHLLSGLDPHALPSALCTEPGGERRWLTVGDSNHLFVLEGPRFEIAGDVIWPVEQQALARVAFHPRKPEAWVSALSSVFVVDRETLKLTGELPIEDELRWHRGERVQGMVGGVVFNVDGTRALVARPLSGDVLEIDTASRRRIGRIPLAVDPLELLAVPAGNRVYVQGLRNGSLSWFPWAT